MESTFAKQIALIEAGLQEPIIKVGNLKSIRTFQDARDAVRAYYLLMNACDVGEIPNGECFNIAGNEAFELEKVVDLLISMSTNKSIKYQSDESRLRPIDADYQMYDNSKILKYINWKPQIKAEKMFLDLLNHWRDQISKGRVPLNR